jgi:hypothetical protein
MMNVEQHHVTSISTTTFNNTAHHASTSTTFNNAASFPSPSHLTTATFSTLSTTATTTTAMPTPTLDNTTNSHKQATSGPNDNGCRLGPG